MHFFGGWTKRRQILASKSPTEYAHEIATDVAVLRAKYDATVREYEKADLLKLRERIAVLEARVVELERCKQEADKRQWQFVYIFAGGMATLLVSAIVQLLISVIKK